MSDIELVLKVLWKIGTSLVIPLVIVFGALVFVQLRSRR